MEKGNLNRERKDAIKAAKDLLYDEEVIEKLKKANTIGEIDIIMTSARKKHWYGYDD